MRPSDLQATGTDGIRCFVTGATFPRDSQEAASAHTANAIAEAQRIAGRTLSRNELIKGITRTDPRSDVQRIMDRQADYLADHPPQPAADDNPYRRALAEGVGAKNKQETMTQQLKRKADEYDARKAEEQRQREFDADPRRQKAVAHATAELQAAKFDQSVTAREHELLQRRLNLAKTGDLQTYKAQAAEWSKVQDARIGERAAAFDSQIAALRERKKAVLNGVFEAEPPAAPATSAPEPEIPVTRMTAKEYQELMQRTEQTERERANKEGLAYVRD